MVLPAWRQEVDYWGLSCGRLSCPGPFLLSFFYFLSALKWWSSPDPYFHSHDVQPKPAGLRKQPWVEPVTQWANVSLLPLNCANSVTVTDSKMLTPLERRQKSMGGQKRMVGKIHRWGSVEAEISRQKEELVEGTLGSIAVGSISVVRVLEHGWF